jgi:hypothetical protein
MEKGEKSSIHAAGFHYHILPPSGKMKANKR